MGKKAELHYDGKVFDIPVVTGTENENALDISKLREESGLITLDKGFKNTGSTESAITFLKIFAASSTVSPPKISDASI